MKKIYIDCSYLSDHAHLNTGIQRVVRKVVENLYEIAPERGYEIRLCTLRDGYARELAKDAIYPKEENPLRESWKASLKEYLKNLYYHTRLWFSALIPWEPFQRFILSPRNSFGLNYILYNYLYKPVVSLMAKKEAGALFSEKERVPMEIEKGDILLLLDSSWYMNIWPAVEEFARKGAMVQMVLYDLIPITHPHFCDDFLAHVFREWIDDSLERVDGYIAISKTVMASLKDYAYDKGIDIEEGCIDYFYLGADFKDSLFGKGEVRKELQRLLGERDTYLCVSTIEPRKNHAYLLDVFDRLWRKGVDVNLLFIGRRGWKVEELIERITTHPEKGKRLFYYDDIDDAELDYAYSHSKALLFASVVEGFGLPLIEGMVKGLPVLASDTPIHREVGGERVRYFDIASVESLANMIEDMQSAEGDSRSEGYEWMSWRSSSEMLLRKIQKLASECGAHG